MVWVGRGDDDDDGTAGVCQKHTAHVYDFGLWQKKMVKCSYNSWTMRTLKSRVVCLILPILDIAMFLKAKKKEED